MLPTQEDINAVKKELKRLRYLAGPSNCTEIEVQGVDHDTGKIVVLFDDHFSGYYNCVKLTKILSKIGSENDNCVFGLIKEAEEYHK